MGASKASGIYRYILERPPRRSGPFARQRGLGAKCVGLEGPLNVLRAGRGWASEAFLRGAAGPRAPGPRGPGPGPQARALGN